MNTIKYPLDISEFHSNICNTIAFLGGHFAAMKFRKNEGFRNSMNDLCDNVCSFDEQLFKEESFEFLKENFGRVSPNEIIPLLFSSISQEYLSRGLPPEKLCEYAPLRSNPFGIPLCIASWSIFDKKGERELNKIPGNIGDVLEYYPALYKSRNDDYFAKVVSDIENGKVVPRFTMMK